MHFDSNIFMILACSATIGICFPRKEAVGIIATVWLLIFSLKYFGMV
jgi:hypothetical protein